MQEVLDTPDSALGFGRDVGAPGRELFRHGADVRPLAGAGEVSGGGAGGAEGSELGRVDEGGDVDVAVAFEGFEEVGRAGGAGGFGGCGGGGGAGGGGGEGDRVRGGVGGEEGGCWGGRGRHGCGAQDLEKATFQWYRSLPERKDEDIGSLVEVR